MHYDLVTGDMLKNPTVHTRGRAYWTVPDPLASVKTGTALLYDVITNANAHDEPLGGECLDRGNRFLRWRWAIQGPQKLYVPVCIEVLLGHDGSTLALSSAKMKACERWRPR